MTNDYVLAHGLNQRPEAMTQWAENMGWPAERGTLIRLPGHAAGESLRYVTADQWSESFSQQYRAAAHEPVVYVGYSLSGLLMTYLLGAGRVPAPVKQILLAPALAFRQWTQLPTFFPLSTDQLLIPSFAPARHKATPGVTISAYKAMFDIRHRLEAFDSATYDIPTLVLCDQRDEMVHPEGLHRFIREKNLSQWYLHVLPSSRWPRWGKKHLLTAREYQSATYWTDSKTQVKRFLET